jgi:hypothetical protein
MQQPPLYAHTRVTQYIFPSGLAPAQSCPHLADVLSEVDMVLVCPVERASAPGQSSPYPIFDEQILFDFQSWCFFLGITLVLILLMSHHSSCQLNWQNSCKSNHS